MIRRPPRSTLSSSSAASDVYKRQGQSMRPDRLADPGPGRPRPRSLDRVSGPGAGLMAAPGPLGHADQRTEPRGRHARTQTDYLEVLEGPSRPSADFFQTRSSTAASPRAWVRSATSASNCCSRVDGPALPATSPARPASKNCRFQLPTDCSETFARRAASATDNSPAKIDSTTRTFSSTGNTGALVMPLRLLQQVTTRNQRDLPQSLTRDTHARVSLAAGIVPSTASMGGSPGRRERAHDQPVVAR